MKQNFFRVTVSNHFQAVIQFLRRELGWKAGDPLVSGTLVLGTPSSALDCFFFGPCAPLIGYHSLHKFTYINLAFSPAPDDTIANLYRVSPSSTRNPCAETNQIEKSRSRRMGIS
jgi:ubiquitin-like protein ATG12